MNHDAKIFVAGHLGLAGSSIVRRLQAEKYNNIIVRSRSELDLSNEAAVFSFFEEERPEYVFLAAAKVGGIHANTTYRADFLYENLRIQNNVIWAAYRLNVKKLLFLGSSCIYPKLSQQPIKEEYLLQAPLEYTNEPYAIAKIAGIKLCESLNIQYGTNFICAMPTNLYGPHDNYDFENSHVLPAILRKIVLAKWWHEERWDLILNDIGLIDKHAAQSMLQGYGIESNKVTLWGSGKPQREFLHTHDLAEACVYLMKHVNFGDLVESKEIRNTHINVGYGEDLSIKELAHLIAKITDFKGDITFDDTRPDGTPKKLMDSSKIFKLGWRPTISLAEGISQVYDQKFNFSNRARVTV